MIERGAQTGYFVPVLTVADVTEVNKIRLALECLAIEEVCIAESPDLSAMTLASEEFARLLEGEYALGVIEADRRFHESLIIAARMRRLSNLYQLAPLPLIHGDTEDPKHWRDACLRTLDEHGQILDALAARNADMAKRVLRTHLTHMPMIPMCH